MFVRIPLLAVAMLVWISPSIAAQELTTESWSGFTMGPIQYNVTVVVGAQFDSTSLRADIDKVLEAVNQAMSTYLPDSEVSRFNAAQETDWFPISSETLFVIQRAQEISELTNGAFDITVKPLVERWNFGPNKKDFVFPTETEVEKLRESIGFRKLSVQLEPPAIKKSIPELQIDLSAIAKGYAVDRVASTIEAAGIDRYFVDVGGEVFAKGNKPDASPWRVGIESPEENARKPHRVIALEGAMATSGDYRNFLIVGDKRYSHEIDPKTGWPVEQSLASVSVVAADCLTADALATAIMVLGPKLASAIATNHEFEFLSIERRENKFVDWSTAKFPAALQITDRDQSSALSVFIGAFIIFGIAILAMAVGAIFSNRPITGSCGGLAAKTDKDGATACSLCEKPVSDCVERSPESRLDR